MQVHFSQRSLPKKRKKHSRFDQVKATKSCPYYNSFIKAITTIRDYRHLCPAQNFIEENDPNKYEQKALFFMALGTTSCFSLVI